MTNHKNTQDVTLKIYQYLVKLVPGLSKGIEAGYRHYSLQSTNKKALLSLSKSRGKMYIELERQELKILQCINSKNEKITHYSSIKSPYIRAEFNNNTKSVRTLCIHDDRPESKFSGHFMMPKNSFLLNSLFEKYLENEFIDNGYEITAKLEL